MPELLDRFEALAIHPEAGCCVKLENLAFLTTKNI